MAMEGTVYKEYSEDPVLHQLPVGGKLGSLAFHRNVFVLHSSSLQAILALCFE